MDEAILGGLRLVQYGAVALLVGVPVFLLGAGRALATPGWTRPVLTGAAVGAALAALAALVTQTAVMAGSWSDALTIEALAVVATQTPPGLSMAVRSGAALVALLVIVGLPTGRAGWAATSAAGLAAAGSFAWSGHAGSAEGPGAVLHPVTDAIHAVAACVWLGALFALSLVAGRRDAAGDPDVPGAFRAFSGTGTVAIVILAVTGAANAAFLVGAEGPAGLADGAWGRLLILKLALFAAMLAFAASNRWRLTPALAAAQQPGDARAALGRLRSSVTAETLVGLALLAVVAALGLQAPPGRL